MAEQTGFHALALAPYQRADYVSLMIRKLPFVPSRPIVSVIRLDGVIGGGSRIGGSVLNDAGLAPIIERAFSRG